MNKGDIALFDAKKHFTYVKPLGNPGGTGETHLFEDETTSMFFAFKKYVPQDARYIDDHYRRFVDEIKMLFKLSHPNIVRIYNYYLYPDLKTGYLQMEYIDGDSIDKYEPFPWGKDWNDIFAELIAAFEYLESNNILHRDIRPSNIFVDKDENVKIIDFGFGKQLDGTKKEDNSILLNWPATEMPDEVQFNREYNHITEIYFVGTLFRHLVKGNNDNFKFSHIIEKMIKIDPAQRYASFTEISQAISEGVLGEIDFSSEEKRTYRDFADALSNCISKYINKYTPIRDISTTLSRLAELIRNSALEIFIPNSYKLIECFVSGRFRYYTNKPIETQTVIDFYSLVISLQSAKQKILFDNIYNRLSTISIELETDDDLPF